MKQSTFMSLALLFALHASAAFAMGTKPPHEDFDFRTLEGDYRVVQCEDSAHKDRPPFDMGKDVRINVTGASLTIDADLSIPEIQDQLNALAPGNASITSPQTCERLSNGNTVITTRFCRNDLPQAIEVTPDKKVVWILKDLKDLGDAVSLQFLDEPVYPEIPGETNH